MLRRGHRRNPHASLSGGDTSSVAIPTSGVGCCGILPDLAGIFGTCGGGGGAEDAAVVHGRTTENGPSGVFVGGSGGGSGCPTFPDPFGLVARKAGRSPRPGASAMSRSRSRSNSPVPPMLLASSRPRPSAPTPPGASMRQSSVFDRRLDRLASGVKRMTSASVSSASSKGRSGAGGGTAAAPGLVPKFRSSPLPFSANLHVTPRPRRVSGQQQGASSVVKNAARTTGRRVRGGAKSGRAGGLSASTGFGTAAAPSTPSAPGFETFQTSSSTNRDRHRKSSALPSMPAMMMP